ncbi:hypothetical protein LTR47_003245 [Exophiala xenobiotica]|nr:hypothetical protein LTR47_003245 [Exophiala xenobiotica]KAK5250442.1 hypothetical protein LTS06_004695 [Exophiala xenobiotica]KAK5354002.1 hypothetical protein LTR61_002697 [Exophiala xenobiotica]KAK5364114.1 hypothetical protein LTS03_009420 [Exophiala xenobiotica]KAK5378457.1 hypothetical protein LTR11_004151 [Exophiala xenobiotica]
MDATKTLPASWYTSQNLYHLEQRAVFYKAWYLVGAVPRFAVDREVDFEFAGVTVIVRHDGNENFTVTRKSDVCFFFFFRPFPFFILHSSSKQSPVHMNFLVTHEGWATQGLELDNYLTPTGLLFTTVDPSAPSFSEWFPASLLELLSGYNFRRLAHRRTIKYPGRFNWKTMVDGYQECLHCQYTHRSFSVKYPPTFYEVHNHHTYSRHIADPANPNDGLFLFFYPICTLNLYGGGMSSFRVCPGDKVGDTRMEFDYYFDDGKGGTEGFEEYFKFVRKVAQEDFELCEVAQTNLERGIYSQGVLNQKKESGVLHYQQLTRKMVVDKFKEEEAEKNALSPASSRASVGYGSGSGQDDVSVSA